MNEFDILKAVGDVDSAYIDEALAARPVKKRARSFFIAAAACAAAFIGFLVLKNKLFDRADGREAWSDPHTANGTGVPSYIYNNAGQCDSHIEIMPFFCLNGNKYYTASQPLLGGSELVGDFVAHIEPALLEEDENNIYTDYIEAAGTVRGDAYMIKGYAANTALCLYQEGIDEPQIFISANDSSRDLGIMLRDCLNIRDNLVRIEGESAASSFNYGHDIHKLTDLRRADGSPTAELENFIMALENAIDVGKTLDFMNEEDRDKYSKLTADRCLLANLSFVLAGGMNFDFSVYEGGYIVLRDRLFSENFVLSDEESILPLLKLVFGAEPNEQNYWALETPVQALERIRRNDRFGSIVPRKIPEKLIIDSAYAENREDYIHYIDLEFEGTDKGAHLRFYIADVEDTYIYTQGGSDTEGTENKVKKAESAFNVYTACELYEKEDFTLGLLEKLIEESLYTAGFYFALRCDGAVIFLRGSSSLCAKDIMTLLEPALRQ